MKGAIMSKSVTGNVQKKRTKSGVRYYPYINTKVDGKNKPEYLGCSFTAKKEALRRLNEEIVLRNSQPENSSYNGNILFADWVAHWLEEKEAQNKIKRTTLRGYRQTVKCHVIPYFTEKKLKLSEVGWSEIEKYMQSNVTVFYNHYAFLDMGHKLELTEKITKNLGIPLGTGSLALPG
jgi:hypothetical protein